MSSGSGIHRTGLRGTNPKGIFPRFRQLRGREGERLRVVVIHGLLFVGLILSIMQSMKFPRPKKLIFVNNKGGVGKTTLAFNCAVSFAKGGYKTALIDLDPQCNLSRLAMGEEYYAKNLFLQRKRRCMTFYEA